MSDSPPSRKRLAWYRLLGTTILIFSIGVAINTLEPSVLGHKVLELTPDTKNTFLGVATFVGLLVAILWQPIIGAISDRTDSRWGRRTPYLILGTIVAIVSLYSIALALSAAVVFLGVITFQFGSNTVQGPWQALIPDQVPRWQRGVASGMKAAFEILGFIVGRRVSGMLVAEGRVLTAITLAAVFYVLGLVITLLLAREPSPNQVPRPQLSISDSLRNTFSVDLKTYPAFKWLFVNRALFWAASIALNTFMLFYMIDVLRMSEGDAQRFVANIFTVLGLALFLVALPSGWLADRIGRRPLLIFSGILAALGTLGLMIFQDQSLLILIGALIGLSVGVFLSTSWAMFTDVVPTYEAARYLGIVNIATAGGSAVARLLGGIVIDPINVITGTSSAGYYVYYSLAVIAFALSTVAILRLKPEHTTRSQPPDGCI